MNVGVNYVLGEIFFFLYVDMMFFEDFLGYVIEVVFSD